MSKCKTLIRPLINEIHEGNLWLVESSDYSHLQKKYPKLGAGELSIITIARDRIAFIEDRDAEAAAREEGLRVYNIPEILLACKRKKLIEKAELVEIITELGERDGYLFKKEIKDELTR